MNANRFRLALAALLCAASVSTALAANVDVTRYDPRQLPVPPIGRIPAVTPERFTLPNGVVVYLLENHELPVVKGTAYFPSSPTLAAADRAGLMGLTG